MKTILYLILAIFIFGIIASAYTGKADTSHTIVIQSVDNTISSGSLTQSAKIISDRLKSFSSEKFDIMVIPIMNKIQVTLTGNWDYNIAEKLVIQRGAFAFYETINKATLSELLKDADRLFSLLNASDNSEAIIGCTSASEINKVNEYLNTVGPEQNIKFAWNQLSGNSDVCLYALRLNTEKGALITRTDIDRIQSEQDKASKEYYIDIKLTKSAAKIFSDATKRNINQVIAIVLDETVISAPIVRSVIDNGKCQITGNFTRDEVRFITALLNNRELPVRYKLVN
jgi:preprotein translocase subunit SecD